MASLKGLIFILLKKTEDLLLLTKTEEREGHAEEAWFF
jgi:hypothetical protein